MRLKDLTLQGYKSFATKTEFLFPTGVTAIVGPNGSGKSNIADSIRWVLGEQSMRTLRGKSSADMIFAGGRRRARAGMAEVSLTFDNSDNWLPIEFSEVTITRRAFRSGDNEYLINGSKVRLRDVSELLAEAGLSERTYTVIGQGLVDAALSLRPQERRDLIEEAAGISLYRSRREKSLDKLEETQHNLERVYDIIAEITPRLERLERQAAQVEDHRRVTAHLDRLQRTWYGYQWGRQQEALDRARERAAYLQTSLDKQQQETEKLKREMDQLREQEGQLRAQLRDWHRESADLHDLANEKQRELAVAEERVRLLKVRREELLAELEPLKGQQDEQGEKIARCQAQIGELNRKLAECQDRLSLHEREWARAKQQAQEAEQRRAQAEADLRSQRAELERLNQAFVHARAEISQLESDRAVAEERARQLETRHQEIVAELVPLHNEQALQAQRIVEVRDQAEQLAQGVEEHRRRAEEVEQELADMERAAEQPAEERRQLERVLGRRRAELERLNRALLEARAEEARLAGQQQALDRLRSPDLAYDAGLQALIHADLEGILGPLAMLMDVPARWERAIEAALGPDLHAVVLRTSSVVEEAHRVLKTAGGRLTLLPLDGMNPPPALPEEATSAASVVTCDDLVRPAVDTVLGSIALCDSLAAARALLPSLPSHARCVTPIGVVLRADGALSVGEAKAEGVLANERARREIPAQLEEIKSRCEEIERQQQVEAQEIADLEAKIEALAEQIVAAREKAAQAERDMLAQARTDVAVARETLRNQRTLLEREESRLQQLKEQEAALRRQADQMEAERAVIVARLENTGAEAQLTPAEADTTVHALEVASIGGAFQDQITRARQRCREIEEQRRIKTRQIEDVEEALTELTRQAAAARDEADRVEREALAKARTDVAVAEEARYSQQSTLKREQALLEQLVAQESARRQRAEELAAEYAAVVARMEAVQADNVRLETQLDQVRARIRPAEDRLTRLQEEQRTLEERDRQIRDRVREAEDRHGRAELDVARCQDELDMLGRRIEEDLGLVEIELADSVTAQSPLPLDPLVSYLPVVEELPEGLEAEIQRLKARLRRLRGVNPNAPADYAEVKERHQFLTEQSADLEAASQKLRHVVEELDEMMEKAFQETFETVAACFSDNFTSLFDGGTARLELTEPGNLMDTGVDIVAQPPRKRAQRLALLSGGERSLTAAALLFALLEVSPTPFCALDEVDAMLDETNVGRFRNLLEKLSDETQFVIITHNRGTVEAADTIYGISMGVDGVSQMLSYKFNKEETEDVDRVLEAVGD